MMHELTYFGQGQGGAREASALAQYQETVVS